MTNDTLQITEQSELHDMSQQHNFSTHISAFFSLIANNCCVSKDNLRPSIIVTFKGW